MGSEFLKTLAAVACSVLVMGACVSPRGRFEHAFERAVRYELPDSDEAAQAFEDLDEAVREAEEALRTDQDMIAPCVHDRTAYIIPMAHLAKAKLHGRFNQIADQEAECWAAIKEAEEHLGGHIRRIHLGGGIPFAQYSVFFRREKIRRHAFILLLESYRRAGEADLVALMRAQIGFSDIYLRSPTAHGEEEYIRTIENADWVKNYKSGVEDIAHTFEVALVTMAYAAAEAGAQMQRAKWKAKSPSAGGPQVKPKFRHRASLGDSQLVFNMHQAMETIEQMDKEHKERLRAIEGSYKDTVLGALIANFEILELSEEVKNLEAYGRLKVKKEAFDDYILRSGFDRNAAYALMNLRSSLDDLTLELQRIRREGEGEP